MYKDDQIYFEDEEYLKKMYSYNNLDKKMRLLTDYYKFHVEIPRVYALPVSLICNCKNI